VKPGLKAGRRGGKATRAIYPGPKKFAERVALSSASPTGFPLAGTTAR
jgi:hypothetical protein